MIGELAKKLIAWGWKTRRGTDERIACKIAENVVSKSQHLLERCEFGRFLEYASALTIQSCRLGKVKIESHNYEVCVCNTPTDT